MKKQILICIVLIFAAKLSSAQNQPNFYSDVQIIKQYDKMFQQPANPILFVGSSSIRKWEHLQMAFGSYNIINRGIGGAVINDISYYLKDIVLPYKPRQIVLYVGENDVVSKDATADTILNRTIRLFRGIRAGLPDVPLVYIALKPSPSRDQHVAKAIEANRLIREFLSHEKNAVFLDIFTPMLKAGKSRPELFVGDMLHMNQQGYDIWEKALKPNLLKQQ